MRAVTPNLLLDPLPTAVTIGDAEYPIRWQHRVGLLFEALMWDKTILGAIKIERALALYYPDPRPADATEAFAAAVRFFCGGQPPAENRAAGPRLYDVDRDADVLYAAFYDQYGIDLQAQTLHWWAYRALFAGLREDHAIVRRMALRGVNLATIDDAALRGRLAREKARWRLDDAPDAGAMRTLAGAVFAPSVKNSSRVFDGGGEDGDSA